MALIGSRKAPRGLGIVYEVAYQSGNKTWIVPFKSKAGTRDARTGNSGAAARAAAVANGAEISDADLNYQWAINWLQKYGGMASEKVASVLNYDTRQVLYTGPAAPSGTVVVTPAPAPVQPAGTKTITLSDGSTVTIPANDYVPEASGTKGFDDYFRSNYPTKIMPPPVIAPNPSAPATTTVVVAPAPVVTPSDTTVVVPQTSVAQQDLDDQALAPGQYAVAPSPGSDSTQYQAWSSQGNNLTPYTGTQVVTPAAPAQAAPAAQDSSYPPFAFTDKKGVDVYFDDAGDLFYFDANNDPQYYVQAQATTAPAKSKGFLDDIGQLFTKYQLNLDDVYTGVQKQVNTIIVQKKEPVKRATGAIPSGTKGLGTFYIPFIDDGRRRQDEENARIIKTPTVDFSQLGIGSNDFFQQALLNLANTSVNNRIAGVTQGWDRQLRDGLHLNGLQTNDVLARTAVDIANQATRERLLAAYPPQEQYPLGKAPVRKRTKAETTILQLQVQTVKPVHRGPMTITQIRKKLGLEQ